MTDDDWEDLCDHCAKCCQPKLFFGGKVVWNNLACPKLDLETHTCTAYEERVEGCGRITQQRALDVRARWKAGEDISEINSLPETCAYVRWTLEQPLPAWHHWRTGTRDTVPKANATHDPKEVRVWIEDMR